MARREAIIVLSCIFEFNEGWIQLSDLNECIKERNLNECDLIERAFESWMTT